MKKINLILAALFLTSFCFAQTNGTINVKQGQKFNVKSVAQVKTTVEAMGQQIETNMSVTGVSSVSVDAVNEDGYDMTGMLTALKMSMSAMGQDMEYDSENPDASSPLAEQTGKILNQPQKVTLNKNGDVVSLLSDGEFNEILKQMGTAGVMAKGAFLVVPSNLKVGDEFDKNEDDKDVGTVSNIKYKVESIDGDRATLSFSGKVKTESTREFSGMEVHIVTDGTSEGEVVVNMKTSVIKTMKTKVKQSGSSEVMGQEMPTDVDAVTTVTVEEA